MSHEADQSRQVEKREVLQGDGITLLPEASRITIEQINELFGTEQKVFVCDFYLADAELRGVVEPYGLDYHNITNIDHHAPIASMEKFVSSAPLAIEYVAKFWSQGEAAIAVNHTDCDSVLSSSIIRGTLPAAKKFVDAAIAADHTGEPNDIADLLQSIDQRRDIDFSLHNLNLLLSGMPIEADAQALLDKRLADRERAKTLVENGAFQRLGKVAYAETNIELDGAFLPALLPDCAVILLSTSLKDKEGNLVPCMNEVKVRLGRGAPEGLTLHKLGLEKTEMHFGGRWNAGNNKRYGGTPLSIQECADTVSQLLSSYNVI